MHKIPPTFVKQEGFFIIMSIKSQKFRQNLEFYVLYR